MFISTALLGRLRAISRTDWMGVWLGLEVNLFRVLPLLLGGGSSGEAESCVKYFVVQMVGSTIMLGGALLGMGYWGSFAVRRCLIREMSLGVVLVGLSVKLGLFPFHFWVPRVMLGVSWEACFGLCVWQKVAPLLVMVGLVEGFFVLVLTVIGCLGRVVGGLGGLRQTQVRALLGYSTINHVR